MSRKPRIHYTETDKALMWDRWRNRLFVRMQSSTAFGFLPGPEETHHSNDWLQ
jgi:hypothetical protein